MNAPMENRGLNNITKNKVFRIVLIVVLVLLIIANGIQGYFMAKKAKAYRVLEAIVENKSNCPAIPVQVEAPAESAPTTTAPTTKRKSSTPSTNTSTDVSPSTTPSTDTSTSPDTSTPEVVIPPPPPPSN